MKNIKNRPLNTILVTGGSGFIGSNFIRYLFSLEEFKGHIINLDSLTYAGNMANLKDIESEYGSTRYFFSKTDISNMNDLEKVFDQYEIDTVIHFAAESHVDRSIAVPEEFIKTNIFGTFNLLECVRKIHKSDRNIHFHHVSTDEVYGSLGETGLFLETTPYDPRSPYSASKASSDHLVRAYMHTYGISATISNCSNNYGPFQFPEKLIPVMLLNMLEEKPLPVYGDGSNIRDWLFVDDHCSGIWEIIKKGKNGSTYNIGGDNEIKNIDLVHILCEQLAILNNVDSSEYTKLITYVTDRPGHDQRYAIDCSKIKNELDWKQSVDFTTGIKKTLSWYLENMDWIDQIRSGAYLNWIEKNYTNR